MARAHYGKIEHDADSDDETLPRTSGEVRGQDQETLNAEEEAEKLLLGHHDTDTFGGRSRVSKKGRRLGFAAVHVVIFVAFLLLVYGAYRATKAKGSSHEAQVASQGEGISQQDDEVQHTQYTPETLSNGTHTFKPTTILISLDGFRADFLHRNISPTLASFIESGVSPKYMLPSFPSLTFPNHFTLVTGLHPESHGVVGNTFFDPDMDDGKGGRGRQFDYGDAAKSMQPEWWTAEPLWLTAEKQGLRTAIHMWPGSEAHIGGVDPAFVDKFNANEALDNKVRRILGWLDLPGEDESPDSADSRPQFIAAYVPDVDADGHAYGPNSTYIRSTIREADSMLGMLFDGLEERNLTDVVNVVIVSDHGMATTSTKRLIQLEDLIDTSLIEHTDGWPLYGLRPYDNSQSNVKSLYKNLRKAAKTSKYKGAFEVYLRDDDMPERYHFSDNHRIAPLWIVPKAGWAIVTKDEFNVETGLDQQMTYSPMGLHGYDNQHPLMRAIFVARGPAFPHSPGSLVDPFQNIEVYNIICDSLGLEPASNNGTLRLPLRPSGMHDGSVEVPEDIQDDPSLALPPPDGLLEMSKGGSTTLPPEVANLANRPDFVVPTEGVPPVSEATPLQTSTPSGSAASTSLEGGGVPETPTDGDEKGKHHTSWWSWVTGKIDAMKGWASSFFGSKDEQKPGDDNQSR
ncbi:Phosphodiest-domain-containing protein [Hortaea werneckii]|uniref:Uncharacterized protein n=2 Tax=Hortaea werneckii TaxID=91943 RepID=A0A3M7I444_HORWE|nr:Phosphodiest-domain-containing protein [Hortaea werneckii]OTA33831.1 hypothetical protein BTJ68_08087 [Hortaea werneckii EXF-2000]KAI6831771.1 Phosphodiest-domain-containing protein [Hortaea werneckii]KAI6925636.1 Phosphodiest-domain-containing protein [Hortaea werneckii]KAI6926611.1 Phosphodiest-domain-containing protein [Hortaea werneckii]